MSLLSFVHVDIVFHALMSLSACIPDACTYLGEREAHALGMRRRSWNNGIDDVLTPDDAWMLLALVEAMERLFLDTSLRFPHAFAM
jgi:hypothetical protein